MLEIKEVLCCGLSSATGLEADEIVISWKLASDRQSVVQSSCRLKITDTDSGNVVYDSGIVETAVQKLSFPGKICSSLRYYSCEVTAADNHGDEAQNTGCRFALCLRQEEWEAKWIGLQKEDLDPDAKMSSKDEMLKAFMGMVNNDPQAFTVDRQLDPCMIYRREFEADDIRQGWLSITAHGLYEARINGIPVTDTCLDPGFTSYDKYLEFQTYDVTGLIKPGTNVFTAVLADGWFKGKYGILGFGNNYGLELALLAQIDMIRQDGARDQIVTDGAFEYGSTKYVYSDLLIGEKQDNRIDMEHYYRPGASGMKPAALKDFGFEELHGARCEPVRCKEIVTPVSVFTAPNGDIIADFGQVLVGYAELRAHGSAGHEIKLEHSEVLDREGNYLNNISGFNRDQTDYFTLRGDAEAEVFMPAFTFHGFRYIKVSGYPGNLSADDIKVHVIGSDLRATGRFSCSDERLNQLQSNISWSQRGNMLSIPTDCPQRERAGWTGDIQVYAETAAYNQDVRNFLDKWLDNMELEQFEDGLIPVIVPYPFAYNAMQKDAFGTDTSAGWGDAAVVIPWTLYEKYDDISILEKHFGMMKCWMDYVEHEACTGVPELPEDASEEWQERQKYLWNTGFHFGDWLYPSAVNENGESDMWLSSATTRIHVASAMFVHSSDLMAKTCKVLGKGELAGHYEELSGKIRDAYEAEYIGPDGRIEGATQGIYVLTLAMKMGHKETLEKTAAHLADMIRANGDRLDTGFLSVQYLLPVLCEYEYADVARTLLYQEACPSWLYEVKCGATTIWEAWDCIRPDGTPTSMSYNHYAFGCIGDWMYRNLLGIRQGDPGYRRFRIEPTFEFGLTHAEGSFESIYGTIECSWAINDKEGTLTVSVPVGTRADIVLPGVCKSLGSGTYTLSFCL